MTNHITNNFESCLFADEVHVHNSGDYITLEFFYTHQRTKVGFAVSRITMLSKQAESLVNALKESLKKGDNER